LCDYHPLVIKPLGRDLEWSIDGSIQRVQKVCHPVGDYNKIGILVKFCFHLSVICPRNCLKLMWHTCIRKCLAAFSMPHSTIQG
jgi:hypothetical protein